jgi:hypothetical protein
VFGTCASTKSSAKTPTSRTCRPSPSERDALPTSASPPTSETPRPLRGLAAWRETKRRRDDHQPLVEPLSAYIRTGRAKPPSRKELNPAPHVTHLQTVGIGAGHPAHLSVAADVRHTPDLLAAWRLGARQTTPHPPPSLSSSRSAPTSGQVAPSRQAAKSSTQPHTSPTSRPLALERDTQPTSASRPTSATPPTSWRLGGLARDKRRRTHPQPLEEPIAQSGQVAPSRQAAKSSTQPHTSPTSRPLALERDTQPTSASRPTSATPPTSWRLGGLAREKQRCAHPRPLEEPIAQSGQVAPSRQAAKSSTQPHTSPTSRPLALERDTQPTSASRPTSATPPTSWRLGGLARDKRRLAHPQPLEEPIAQSGQVAQSRQGAKSSAKTPTSRTCRPSPSELDALPTSASPRSLGVAEA